ncbi:hypothetical protein BC830DRAFT_359968 [Chytriomyces sp. MP71]|nr:hypothetical protein BC830DRAFT_359968 [Chytriomyces sp. MP71]
MPRTLSSVLGDETLGRSLLGFCVFQAVFYAGFVSLFPASTVKQRGWLLTALNSFVSTAVSIPYLFSWFAGEGRLPEQDFQSWTVPTTVFCAFFMSYLIGDLVLGTLFYPSQMNWGTGYFHHTMYLVLLPLAMMSDIAGNFTLMCILELPTLLLALAQINKSLRHDYVFGASYFLTRILLHVYAIYEFWIGYPGSFINRAIPIAIFPLHAMWFRQWCRQQLRLRRKMRVSKKGDNLKDDFGGRTLCKRNTTEAAIKQEILHHESQLHSADHHKDITTVFLGNKKNNASGRLRVAGTGKRATMSFKN